MPTEILNSDNWLKLGELGAVLFILLVFVVLFMWVYVSSNNKNISNLCNKIDKLADTNTNTAEKMATSNLEITKAMTQVFTKANADQETNQNTLNQIHEGVNDLKASVESLAAKTETLLELKCRPMNK